MGLFDEVLTKGWGAWGQGEREWQGRTGQDRAGQGSLHLAYLLAASLALKLLTNTSQVCADAIMRRILRRGAVAVLSGDR